MKKLVLSDIHEQLGAKMVEFAGYYMPIQYDGVKIEHNIVRNSVGVFDVSHMGEVFVEGEEALDFLQYICSNDVSKLEIGDVQYSYFPNNEGGIVDDFLLYMVGVNKYLLVINASNIDKDLKWINSNNKYNCEINNQSDNYSLIAVQGPKSIELLQQLTKEKLSEIKYYNFKKGNIAGIEDILISRTGYTGELGFELYVKNEDIERLWKSIFNTEIEIKPIGLAARDTLRLEKGYCLYGNDINERTSPIEAGLGWVTKFNKNFINCDNLKDQKNGNTINKLVGIELIDRGVARKDYDIIDEQNNIIGIVTSGTMSPTLSKAIALGYIKKEFSKIETIIYIKVRNKNIKAKITKLPFV